MRGMSFVPATASTAVLQVLFSLNAFVFRFSRKAVVERVQFVFLITKIYGFWD
jgi:hypothetical protein